MSGEAAFVQTWQVGKRTATLSAPRPKRGAVQAALIEWEPNVPDRLTDAELQQYRVGRDQALADLAQQLGITVAVLEA